MADRILTTVFRPLGHTQPLLDGTVKPRSFDLDYVNVEPLIAAFRRMVRGYEFDICELAITTYITAKSYGKKFTAVPIFPARAFHHGAILVNTKAGIASPKDLEGKRVGVSRGYTVTTGVWARAILQDELGVDLSKVTWVLSGDEHVEEYQAPPNVVPVEKGTKIEDMLIAGELPAAVNVEVDHPDVKPLIAKPRDTAFAALKSRGLYPINHTVVVRDELLDSDPGLAADVFNAFAEAKRLYIERLKKGTIAVPTKADETNKTVMDMIGDPLPYGIGPNRKVLETLVQAARNQRILKNPVTVETLFAKGTHDLVA
jgi:4,5-dihydroxyphthalate decarboxylase